MAPLPLCLAANGITSFQSHLSKHHVVATALLATSYLSSILPENAIIDRQVVSNTTGTLSFIIWLFAQSPQILENYRRKSVEGLSFVFLAQWMAGDVTNLIGSLLTKQLPFQIAVAAYFCTVDCVILFQWIHYTRLQRASIQEGARTVSHYRTMTTAGRLSLGRSRNLVSEQMSRSRYSSTGQSASLQQQQQFLWHAQAHGGSDGGSSINNRSVKPWSRSSRRRGQTSSGSRRMDTQLNEAAKLPDMSASADLGALSRGYYGLRRSMSGASEATEMRGSLSTLASDCAYPQSQLSQGGVSQGRGPGEVAVSHNSLQKRHPSVSPPRGRSFHRRPDLEEPQHQPSGSAPNALARQHPPSSRSRSSYRQLTHEAIRVAILAEKLEQRGRSRDRAGREHVPRRMTSLQSAAQDHVNDGRVLSPQLRGQEFQQCAVPMPTFPVEETTPLLPSRQPFLDQSNITAAGPSFGTQATGSRVADRPSRAPQRRRRKVGLAGILSALGIGGLLGLGEVSDGLIGLKIPEMAANLHSLSQRLQTSVPGQTWFVESPLHPMPGLDAKQAKAEGIRYATLGSGPAQPSNGVSPPMAVHSGASSGAWIAKEDVHEAESPHETPALSWRRLIGRVSSWVCTILYLTSRLPQIWRNHTRKSVEGLSVLLFMAAFSGNLFYTISILSSPAAAGNGSEEYIRESVPFLLGSGGTLIFDAIVVGQWLTWRKKTRPPHHREAR